MTTHPKLAALERWPDYGSASSTKPLGPSKLCIAIMQSENHLLWHQRDGLKGYYFKNDLIWDKLAVNREPSGCTRQVVNYSILRFVPEQSCRQP